MCRIAGFFSKNSINNPKEIGNTMRDMLAYGGPDDIGDYMDEDNGVYFGHRRLSI